MPYRYFLVPLFASLLLDFSWMTYLDLEPDPWIMVGLTCLIVGTFIFQHQINNRWWSVFPIDLDAREKSWIARHLPYFVNIPEAARSEFFRELARQCINQEFISMSNQKVHEEWKWLCTGPAIALGLHRHPEIMEHHIRTAIYPHPFISPEIPHVHISETHFEDGLMIFSLENLHRSHEDPRQWLNPALYEWCRVAVKAREFTESGDPDTTYQMICEYLGVGRYQEILEWMGQTELDADALVLYLQVMDPVFLRMKDEALSRTVERHFSWNTEKSRQ